MRLQCTDYCGRTQGIILSSYVTQNLTDHFELIPPIEELKSNLEEIYDELHSNFQFNTDNRYSTDENTPYLEEKELDGYISTRKLSRKEKSTTYGKTIPKRQFHICRNRNLVYPLGEILYRRKTCENKNKPKITY